MRGINKGRNDRSGKEESGREVWERGDRRDVLSHLGGEHQRKREMRKGTEREREDVAPSFLLWCPLGFG